MKLRLLMKEDLPARVDFMNHESIYKSMGFTPPISIENTERWYESNKTNKNRFDAVFETDEGEYAAFGGLTNIDHEIGKAEFYIFVNPSLHGKGLGTEATKMLCKYGFEVLNLYKIYLLTNSSNVKARHIYEKVGFKLEGLHRGEKVISGNREDRCYYGLLSHEFDGKWCELTMIGNNGVVVHNQSFEGVDIKVVRDDLYPDLGGGYKIKKIK